MDTETEITLTDAQLDALPYPVCADVDVAGSLWWGPPIEYERGGGRDVEATELRVTGYLCPDLARPVAWVGWGDAVTVDLTPFLEDAGTEALAELEWRRAERGDWY